MKFEQRLFLAIVISILVLIIYDIFFMRRKPVPKTEKKTVVTEQVEKQELRPEKELVPKRFVEKSKLKIGMSGDKIVVAYLKNFAEKPGSEERVKLGNPRGFPILKLYVNGKEVETKFSGEGLEFESEKNSLKLRKIYNMGKDYVVDVRTIVENRGREAVAVSLLAAMPEITEKESQFIAIKNDGSSVKKKGRKAKWSGKNVEVVGMASRYFVGALMGESSRGFITSQKDGVYFGLISKERVISPGDAEAFSFKIYLGPKKREYLEEVLPNLVKFADFGIFGPIALALLAVLKIIHKVIGNWGLAIIVLSVIVRIVFTPLNAISMRAMKKMRELQPKIEELKKKYKDDKERFSKEMMALYRREKINPFSGCLPMLIQIPIFFALYKALMNAIELRHAPFVLWIRDLSSPDTITTLSLGGFGIPIRVLPLLMGATLFVQQFTTPYTSEEMKILNWVFPIMFTFLLWGLPSGLHLYWVVTNVIAIIHQISILKK